MTTIGAPPSPQQMIQSQLSSKVDSGEITETDEDAMLAALEAISDDMAPEEGAPLGEPPSKDEMQEKLEGLLSDQVEAGTLTQEQADELSSMFESGELGGPPPGGAPAGPPPSDMAASESDDEEDDLMAKLLEELQAATSSSSSYSASGDSTSTSASSLLVDYLA